VKSARPWLALLLLAPLGLARPSLADTVRARCDVSPRGDDRATSSGPCTFSQRQGVMGIQLANGRRYDLVPVGVTWTPEPGPG
jgi:hypothetical protein